jgi:lysophospholipase L1-like esterase
VSRIYLIPTELNIDCTTGYPEKNGVHPNAKGYKQLATSIFSWMKWLLHKDVIKN